MRRSQLVTFSLALLLAMGCAAGNSNTQTISSGCSVSATSVGSVATLNISCTGSSSYTVSNILIGGVAPSSSTGSLSFSSSATLTATMSSLTNLSGVSGSLTITDAASNANSYSFSVVASSSTTSNPTNTNTVIAPTCWLNQTVVANGNISVQAMASSGESLLLTSVNAGADGTVVSSGNPTVVSYATSGTKTFSAFAYSASSGAVCSGGVLTLNFSATAAVTSTSSFTCTLSRTVDALGNISFTATSSNGHALAFANFNAGANGTISSYSNPLVVAYSVSGTKTISTQAYDVTNNVFCNAGSVVSQTFYAAASISSAPTCTLNQGVDAWGRTAISASASSGEALALNLVSAGDSGVLYASGNPTYLGYVTAGLKTVYAKAYSISSGQYCNGGSLLTVSFYAYPNGTSGSSLACTPILSASPASRGSVVTASFQSSGGIGAVKLQNIRVPAAAGASVVFTSATTANLTFAYSGIDQLVFVIQDAAGNRASCSVAELVY